MYVLTAQVKDTKENIGKGETMNLYKVKYTQESEAFVQAESEAEALEFITELTENGGGDKMSSVRLNECGRSIEEELGELEELGQEDDYGNTHKTNWGYYAEGDYGLFYDL